MLGLILTSCLSGVFILPLSVVFYGVLGVSLFSGMVILGCAIVQGIQTPIVDSTEYKAFINQKKKEIKSILEECS